MNNEAKIALIFALDFDADDIIDSSSDSSDEDIDVLGPAKKKRVCINNYLEVIASYGEREFIQHFRLNRQTMQILIHTYQYSAIYTNLIHTGQAMEIGAAAISFLIETWEAHLTPPEAASIADRASRGCDPNMVRAAAELALSCLPHSHALNPNEIQRAILQCKEQSEVMLEHACLTVESAAKGGGVYPEVLFQVAKYWYELYVRHTPGGELLLIESEVQQDHLLEPYIALLDTNIVEVPQPSGPSVVANNGPVVVTTAPPPQYQHPTVTTLASLGMSVPYAVTPYSFAVHHPHVSYGSPIHPHAVQLHQPPPPHMQMYLPSPQFQYPPQPNNQQFNNSQQPPAYVNQQGSYAVPPPGPPNYVAGPVQTPPYSNPGPQIQANIQYYSTAVTIAQSNNLRPTTMPMFTVPVSQNGPQQVASRQQPPRQPQHLSQVQLRYLLATYRVGMLAMETLARRVHDDRPQAKYARNPPYGEDVKWLLCISKHLGTQYLHQFCICAVNSIVSPFVLHDVAIESAQYLSRNNPGLVMQHLRSALTPLVQKCQQMYIQCMHQKLYHLMPADYEDFVSIVSAARAAFQITPEGSGQFKEWLQSIRRTKSCKKDLWTQINAALQANTK